MHIAEDVGLYKFDILSQRVGSEYQICKVLHPQQCAYQTELSDILLAVKMLLRNTVLAVLK